MATATEKKNGGDEETFPIKLVKRLTGAKDWNVAKGVYETQVHGETGEPTAEYLLIATIDGVEVPIGSYNAGRLETVVRSQKLAEQSDAA